MTPKKEGRPDSLRSTTQRIDTGMGKVYVTISENQNGQPFEVFVNTGQSGGYTNSWCQALGITISNALRSGADPRSLGEDLMGIRTDKIGHDNGDVILSIPDAVAVALIRHTEGKISESIRDGPPEVQLP